MAFAQSEAASKGAQLMCRVAGQHCRFHLSHWVTLSPVAPQTSSGCTAAAASGSHVRSSFLVAKPKTQGLAFFLSGRWMGSCREFGNSFVSCAFSGQPLCCGGSVVQESVCSSFSSQDGRVKFRQADVADESNLILLLLLNNHNFLNDHTLPLL